LGKNGTQLFVLFLPPFFFEPLRRGDCLLVLSRAIACSQRPFQARATRRAFLLFLPRRNQLWLWRAQVVGIEPRPSGSDRFESLDDGTRRALTVAALLAIAC
jgi:hypothetical protein